MSDKPTIEQLLSESEANFPTMRRLAWEVLKPGPWKHDGIEQYDGYVMVHVGPCRKCGFDSEDYRLMATGECKQPDPDLRPLPVIVAEMVKKCQPMQFIDSIPKVHDFGYWPQRTMDEQENSSMWWFIFTASPAEQLACILVALGLAVVEEQHD